MNVFHVIIQTERRHAPRELATNVQGQLHSMGQSVADFNDPQILYAAEWDQVSPYVILHKGSIADLKMQYAGWPMISKEDWAALNPKQK